MPSWLQEPPLQASCVWGESRNEGQPEKDGAEQHAITAGYQLVPLDGHARGLHSLGVPVRSNAGSRAWRHLVSGRGAHARAHAHGPRRARCRRPGGGCCAAQRPGPRNPAGGGGRRRCRRLAATRAHGRPGCRVERAVATACLPGVCVGATWTLGRRREKVAPVLCQ